MRALQLDRHELPFWPAATFAALAWLVAWFVAWPLSQWATFELLGLEHGSSFYALGHPKLMAAALSDCVQRMYSSR